jgi:hypothetical protein
MIALIDGDVLLYQAMWGCDTLKEACNKFDEILEEVLESTFATDYAITVGGKGNFRQTLYADYKRSASRVKSKSIRAEWFEDLKSYVSDKEETAIAHGCEADDIVRIWAEECRAASKPFVVVTVDKDLKCIPGYHYNPIKRQLFHMSANESDKFYWKQVLMGDTVDNIPGLMGIGPKKADKILFGSYNRTTRVEAVCRAYHEHHPEDGYERMLMNGKLLHMWRTYGDHFVIQRSVYEDAVR